MSQPTLTIFHETCRPTIPSQYLQCTLRLNLRNSSRGATTSARGAGLCNATEAPARNAAALPGYTQEDLEARTPRSHAERGS
eukprot:2698770-Amphidinium_carterae.1